MRRGRWRKWLGLAILALALIGPPLVYGISNLFLLSPQGRAYVSSRIQRVIQLDTSVQGCSWSPWNGFTVYGLIIKQPEPLRKIISTPLLTVESIRIHPDWRVLAKRRIVVRSVEIEKPKLAVPIELLAQIPSAPVEPQALVAVDPSPRDRPAIVVPDHSPPDLAAVEKQNQDSGATLPIVTTPTFWISIREGQLSMVSAFTREPIYRISRVDGSIPLGGKSAEATLTLGGISLLGIKIPERVSVPLKWNAPVLGVGVIEGGIFGIACNLEAKIALTQGIPFLIGGSFPKQDGNEVVLSESLRAKLGTVGGQGRLQGLLLAPSSWHGQGIVQALAVDTEYAGHKANFDHGQALAIFQGGAFRCLDARLVGEEVSLLGNGMLLSDGRYACAARIVALPETLVLISKITPSDGSAPQLTALSTPQRAALDMRFFGFPGRVFYQSNPSAQPMPLR